LLVREEEGERRPESLVRVRTDERKGKINERLKYRKRGEGKNIDRGVGRCSSGMFLLSREEKCQRPWAGNSPGEKKGWVLSRENLDHIVFAKAYVNRN